MAEISREDLRQHCIRTIENCKKMAEHFGYELENHKSYQEHKMVLDLIEKAEKLEKIEQIISNISDYEYEDCEFDMRMIEKIVKGE